MGSPVRTGPAIAFLLFLAPFALASPAALDAHVLVLPPSADPTTGAVGTRGGYAPIAVVADVAGTLTLTNADVAAHDLIAHDAGPADNPWCAEHLDHGYCPLFASPMVGLGGSTVVEGTDQLVPGTTYAFYCSIHHWMEGTIVAI